MIWSTIIKIQKSRSGYKKFLRPKRRSKSVIVNAIEIRKLREYEVVINREDTKRKQKSMKKKMEIAVLFDGGILRR
ncbi:MAG: hypothetical protein AAB508_01200 [Patescibacteria group bacterium]